MCIRDRALSGEKVFVAFCISVAMNLSLIHILRDVDRGIFKIKDLFAELTGEFKINIRVPVILVGFQIFANIDEQVVDSNHFQVVGNNRGRNQFPEADDPIVLVIVA